MTRWEVRIDDNFNRYRYWASVSKPIQSRFIINRLADRLWVHSLKELADTYHKAKVRVPTANCLLSRAKALRTLEKRTNPEKAPKMISAFGIRKIMATLPITCVRGTACCQGVWDLSIRWCQVCPTASRWTSRRSYTRQPISSLSRVCFETNRTKNSSSSKKSKKKMASIKAKITSNVVVSNWTSATRNSTIAKAAWWR